jgi:hypothetical protein
MSDMAKKSTVKKTLKIAEEEIPLITEESVSSQKTAKGDLTMVFYYENPNESCEFQNGKPIPKKISAEEWYNLSKILNEELPDTIKIALLVTILAKKKDTTTIRKVLDVCDNKKSYDAKELKISDS